MTKINVCVGSNCIDKLTQQCDQLLLDSGRLIEFVQLLHTNAIGRHDQKYFKTTVIEWAKGKDD